MAVGTRRCLKKKSSTRKIRYEVFQGKKCSVLQHFVVANTAREMHF